MENKLTARRNLSKSGNKGFTLVELIIVIVIIAILIAALLPTVIGAIERANVAADQADARTIMTAASVWASTNNQSPADGKPATTGGASVFTAAALDEFVPGFTGQHAKIVNMKWDGQICIAVAYGDRSNNGVWVSVGGGVGTGDGTAAGGPFVTGP
ncbi:MAG: prepilin-type N-terminal cleavage/methylation domain-containing protein [Oscillospiraceae bacterium]|nr:prepilin-type N-terminal cleavage/methylation domain-containing protein [Oscillospiraceae bacterium]